MRKFNRRLLLWIGIIIAIVLSLGLISAPATEGGDRGSSYGRSPGGYGAWYAYMRQGSAPIERWRKPLKELFSQEQASTLVRIYPELTGDWLDSDLMAWVKRGNNLVILGVRKPVTEAPFSSIIPSEEGGIKIDTTRRTNSLGINNILGDKYGPIVWSYSLGAGKIVQAVTPYLAANAYQDSPGNFPFLARLVTGFDRPIWIDEYIHGYKDKQTLTEEVGKSIWSYLARTPLLVLFIQGSLLLVIAILAGNQRAGKPDILAAPETNNSEAYIQALAAILQKAKQSKFVMERINQAERSALGKKYNLDVTSGSNSELFDALSRDGKSLEGLEKLLEIPKNRQDDRELTKWLRMWRDVKLKL